MLDPGSGISLLEEVNNGTLPRTFGTTMMKDLFYRMVSIRPEARPDADEIVTELKKIICDLNNKIMSDLSYA
jgi:hypothetical protein